MKTEEQLREEIDALKNKYRKELKRHDQAKMKMALERKKLTAEMQIVSGNYDFWFLF